MGRSKVWGLPPISARNMLADLPYPQPAATYLPPDQESAYRAWLGQIGMTKQKGFNLDDNFTGKDYDLRGFFKKYGPVNVNVEGGQHFTDEFKLPNHDTFSNQSMYATGAAVPFAGTWEGDTYTPSPAQTRRGKQKFTE